MLRRVGGEYENHTVCLPIGEAAFPAPFPEGLEYSSPARGCWNIVHTGMLIPQSHQIFVCAQGCLRGVVLTAAEMGMLARYSAVAIREENVLEGNMEDLMVQGVADVLDKLSYRPRCVLLFISCQHFFLAYDQKLVFQTLRERFPDIDFADCYMIPTLRKSGITPDQRMRVQLYSLLKARPGQRGKIYNEKKKTALPTPEAESGKERNIHNGETGLSAPREDLNPAPDKRVDEVCPAGCRKNKIVNLIGSNLPLSPSSELAELIREVGWELKSLNSCKTYDDYLSMADSSCNLYYEPIAKNAAEDLHKRLGQNSFYLPFVYQADRLRENYKKLAAFLAAEEEKIAQGHREPAGLSDGEDEELGRKKASGSGLMSQAGIEPHDGQTDAEGKGETAAPDCGSLFPGRFKEILDAQENRAREALANAHSLIGSTPVAVDYTFTFRILSFTRMLLENGFHVTRIYADAFQPEEQEDFLWIQQHYPQIQLSATNRPQMRFLEQKSVRTNAQINAQVNTEAGDRPLAVAGKKTAADVDIEAAGLEKILAIGQKAAFFSQTDYFVNVAESGGLYGFDGIAQIAALMEDAFLHKKDRKSLIQKKGYGCASCLP